MAIVSHEPADELSGVALVQLSVDTRPQLERVDVIAGRTGRDLRIEMAMDTLDPTPDAASFNEPGAVHAPDTAPIAVADALLQGPERVQALQHLRIDLVGRHARL